MQLLQGLGPPYFTTTYTHTSTFILYWKVINHEISCIVFCWTINAVIKLGKSLDILFYNFQQTFWREIFTWCRDTYIHSNRNDNSFLTKSDLSHFISGLSRWDLSRFITEPARYQTTNPNKWKWIDSIYKLRIIDKRVG